MLNPDHIVQFLRKTPQPVKVVVITEDDDKQEIKLSKNLRNRWKGAAEAIRGARAVTVQCLDEDDAITRSEQIDWDDAEDPEDAAMGSERREERRAEKTISKERRELAGVLEQFGNAICNAFKMGVEAAAGTHDRQLAHVDMLLAHELQTRQLYHTLSLEYARLIRSNGEDEGEDENLKKIIELAGAGLKGMMAQQTGSPPNGKKE